MHVVDGTLLYYTDCTRLVFFDGGEVVKGAKVGEKCLYLIYYEIASYADALQLEYFGSELTFPHSHIRQDSFNKYYVVR